MWLGRFGPCHTRNHAPDSRPACDLWRRRRDARNGLAEPPQILRNKFDWLREVLAFEFEASLMTGQAQQTAIILLGSWRHGAAIIAVPTAIAGIYGMTLSTCRNSNGDMGYFNVYTLRLDLAARSACRSSERRSRRFAPLHPLQHALGALRSARRGAPMQLDEFAYLGACAWISSWLRSDSAITVFCWADRKKRSNADGVTSARQIRKA